jgi:hypothetical protein
MICLSYITHWFLCGELFFRKLVNIYMNLVLICYYVLWTWNEFLPNLVQLCFIVLEQNLSVMRYFCVCRVGTAQWDSQDIWRLDIGQCHTTNSLDKIHLLISTDRSPSNESGISGNVKSTDLVSAFLAFSGAVDLSVSLVVANPDSDRVHLVSATSAPPSSSFHFLLRQR